MLRLLALVAGLLYASGVFPIKLALNWPGLKGEQAAATTLWWERTALGELKDQPR